MSDYISVPHGMLLPEQVQSYKQVASASASPGEDQLKLFGFSSDLDYLDLCKTLQYNKDCCNGGHVLWIFVVNALRGALLEVENLHDAHDGHGRQLCGPSNKMIPGMRSGLAGLGTYVFGVANFGSWPSAFGISNALHFKGPPDAVGPFGFTLGFAVKYGGTVGLHLSGNASAVQVYDRVNDADGSDLAHANLTIHPSVSPPPSVKGCRIEASVFCHSVPWGERTAIAFGAPAGGSVESIKGTSFKFATVYVGPYDEEPLTPRPLIAKEPVRPSEAPIKPPPILGRNPGGGTSCYPE